MAVLGHFRALPSDLELQRCSSIASILRRSLWITSVDLYARVHGLDAEDAAGRLDRVYKPPNEAQLAGVSKQNVRGCWSDGTVRVNSPIPSLMAVTRLARLGVPRTVSRDALGHLLGAAIQEAARKRSRHAGSWMRVLTWKNPHVAADRRAAETYSGIMLATLVREQDNAADANAVQVWIDGEPIGYVESSEAAHLQPVFERSDHGIQLPVRRSRRVKSPYFDIFMPNPHGGFEERTQCEVCKGLDAESRERRHGT